MLTLFATLVRTHLVLESINFKGAAACHGKYLLQLVRRRSKVPLKPTTQSTLKKTPIRCECVFIRWCKAIL